VIEWLNAGDYESDAADAAAAARAAERLAALSGYDGVIVPGGFGARGAEGKIAAIRAVREKRVPYLGLCYGMQLAVAEYARSMLGLSGAHTTEVDPRAPHPVIDILPEQKKIMSEKRYGGTMRLGAYPALLAEHTLAREAYGGAGEISERHRHRYEVNPDYIERLERGGMVFSGRSPDGILMEIVELPRAQHPFFLGTQFHPELKARPLSPHPLFLAFIRAAAERAVSSRQGG
jgi:CTP synthase